MFAVELAVTLTMTKTSVTTFYSVVLKDLVWPESRFEQMITMLSPSTLMATVHFSVAEGMVRMRRIEAKSMILHHGRELWSCGWWHTAQWSLGSLLLHNSSSLGGSDCGKLKAKFLLQRIVKITITTTLVHELVTL